MESQLYVGTEDGTGSSSDVCVVCLEEISPRQATWTCSTCYELMHLSCVQAWIAKRGPSHTTLSREHFPQAHEIWSCPKCRAAYAVEPRVYYCFCGKTDLGKYGSGERDAFVAPHSCGEICGKTLSECSHTCAILCHRSACPQCTRTVKVSCWCGGSKSMQRCGKIGYGCGKRCAKILPCGHACGELCHSGSCPSCPDQTVRSCQCGALAKVARPCALGKIDCGKKACGGVLSCGFHKCERGCHEGSCGPCPQMGRRTCPCGATQYSMVCDEKPPPKCKNACGKRLGCGHVCQSLCHDGPCECSLAVTKTCRCGNLKKQGVVCSSEFTCQSKCNNDRPCGKHKCRRKCCPGDCPPCGEVCGGHLSCGNHKCESNCHKGPCLPCTRKVRIPCACGQTIIRVDCGKESLVNPPKCKFVCSYQVCHHKPSHQCHFGPCPPCQVLCGKVYEQCGHPDPMQCHDPAYPLAPQLPVFKYGELFRTRKEENVEKETIRQHGPRVRRALADVQCGPCQTIVKRVCIGRHDEFERLCSTDPSFACEGTCDALLQCTHHRCLLGCHVIAADGSSCQQCSRQCDYIHPLCGHQCPLPCHPDSTPHPVCASTDQCAHRYPECHHRCPLTCHPVSVPHPVCKSPEQCTHRYPGCGHQCPLSCHPRSTPHPVCASPEQCTFRYRLCEHQCPLTCHPSSVPHPPCAVPLLVVCHCGHTTTTLKCFESTNKELITRVKACNAQCPKNKSCGFHRCQRSCHDVAVDPCDSLCTKPVAVTCSCRSTKGTRLPCDQVVALRKQKGLAFDSPAVLDCSDECAVKQKEAEELQRQKEREDEKAKLERRTGGKRSTAARGKGSVSSKVPTQHMASPSSSSMVDTALRVGVAVVFGVLLWMLSRLMIK